MLKKLTSPYRYAPSRISIDRIDDMLACGAQCEIQSSGRRSFKAVDMVTFRVGDEIVDQFPVHGHVSSTMKFVAAYNRRAASLRPG